MGALSTIGRPGICGFDDDHEALVALMPLLRCLGGKALLVAAGDSIHTAVERL